MVSTAAHARTLRPLPPGHRICALLPGWAAPAAVAGGLFFALAGWKHVVASERNTVRNVAMVSDLFMALVLAGYLALMGLRAL